MAEPTTNAGHTSSTGSTLELELEQHWTALQQDDIGSGLLWQYSSTLSVTQLSSDLFLIARDLLLDGDAIRKIDLDKEDLDSFREDLSQRVFDLLHTGAQSYGRLIWPERTADAEGIPPSGDLSPNPNSEQLTWSSQQDRQTIIDRLVEIVLLNMKYVQQLHAAKTAQTGLDMPARSGRVLDGESRAR